jgi:hypothetical protein
VSRCNALCISTQHSRKLEAHVIAVVVVVTVNKYLTVSWSLVESAAIVNASKLCISSSEAVANATPTSGYSRTMSYSSSIKSAYVAAIRVRKDTPNSAHKCVTLHELASN